MKHSLKKHIKKTLRHSATDRRGAVLAIALAVMLVVIMLGLALALVSFNLYHAVLRHGEQEQCKMLAQGMCKVIDAEITEPIYLADITDASVQKMKEDYSAGRNQLWFYLRTNLLTEGWKYFNEDVPGHDDHNNPYLTKVWTIDQEIGKKTALLTLRMYWESDLSAGDDEEGEDGSGIPLVIEVNSQVGKQTYTIITRYNLVITKSEKHDLIELGTASIDNDYWMFSLSDRS